MGTATTNPNPCHLLLMEDYCVFFCCKGGGNVQNPFHFSSQLIVLVIVNDGREV